MDWVTGIAGLIVAMLMWALIGLVIAWLFKVTKKRDRLPRWPIYGCAAVGLVATLIVNLMLGAIIAADLVNSN